MFTSKCRTSKILGVDVAAGYLSLTPDLIAPAAFGEIKRRVGLFDECAGPV